ncbi:uncharacterized protein LOC126892298 [Diabrotica virgifera virgifera]|uniref:Uncharacterized protein LOC114344860 n=1 Tax=Diabrotica virgifera virgifera TaxID=50390 RepID=A0A6P7H184_DIAVI|nr:uncharacterized protein LOC126892298 [Diabrotica virgifera virgifera]
MGTNIQNNFYSGINSDKAISLCVSTRAAGFGAAHIFNVISHYQNVPNAGNIYQYYRICLAILESKAQVVQRSVTVIQNNEDDYAKLILNYEFITTMIRVMNYLPDQITNVANAIRKIGLNGRMYIPKFGRNNLTKKGLFIPQSEQVTYSNLRRVVIALADNETPRKYREQFYVNNPIPGAIWNNAPQDPTLANPNEIMPECYTVSDLDNDICDVQAKMHFLRGKASEYFKERMSYETESGKSMLVCNEQGSLRVKDRQPNQELAEYYAALKVEGNVEKYYNLERLTYDEQITGNIALLGEQPSLRNLRYPVYITRDKRVCCQYSGLAYISVRNFKYT